MRARCSCIWMAELARCRRLNSPLVVLVCDMNGFKQVNDKYGHLEGNRVLHAVADEVEGMLPRIRLRGAHGRRRIRAGAAGHEGGCDPGHKSSGCAPSLPKRATRCAGNESCRLSIGHALFPEDGTDADQLLSEADRRMYMAKQNEKLMLVDRRGYDFDPQPAITQW